MPIFVPSLRRADPEKIARMVALCTQAVRNSCMADPQAGQLSGVFDNYEQTPSLRTISYIFSADEEANMYRANPHNRPLNTTKRTIYQEVGGKCFYCPEPIVVRHAEVKAFLTAMQKALDELGFTRCQLTPVAIQKVQRTVIPATKLVRTRVSDVVLGELVYMIKGNFSWSDVPNFPEELNNEEEKDSAQ